MIPEFETPQEALAHYGVKGMRWGIRKERESTATNNKRDEQEYEKNSKEIRDRLISQGVNVEALRAKHEPDSNPLPEAKKGLSPAQKKALLYGGVSALAIGFMAYNQYSHQTGTQTSLAQQRAYSPLYMKDGLELNWSSGVSLPKGSIIRRVSSTTEKTVRDGGFFGVHKESDLEVYKAVLPAFWKTWGKGDPNKGGSIVHIRANQGLKAPSGSETLKMFKDVIRSDSSAAREMQAFLPLQAGSISKLIDSKNPADDDMVKSIFKQSAMFWANGAAENSKTTQAIFREAKKQGYNALIDFNDAGTLGDTPLRVIGGSGFEVIKNEVLQPKTIRKSAKDYLNNKHANLGHSEEKVISMSTYDFETPQDALAHYGVKGMRWGYRKDALTGVSARTNREAAKDAKEYARAKMFYGEGAGTRRKLINKSVESKAKRDSSYKKAFDHHLEKQDLSRHASKARSERRRKDTKSKVGRTIRGTRHVLNGNSQYASATVALAAGGALYAHKTGIDKVIYNNAKTYISDARRHSSNHRAAQDFLRNMGM